VCLACIKHQHAQVAGLPAELGGIPVDVIGATAWGVRHAVEVALPYCGISSLAKTRVAIQGFGAVGRYAARFLAAPKSVLVGASDSQGSVYNPDGLDVDELFKLKEAGKSVIDYPGGKKFDRDGIIDFDCDIWIPAARPDVVHEDNVHRLKAKLVVEGANISLTYGAEKYLHEKGVVCVPDFIANAGAVICSSIEYRRGLIHQVFEIIEEKVRWNTKLILEESRTKNIMPREAAMRLALERLEKAMSFKRWSIY
jgi:glutamate dehydrogenase (NAD(P)+)